MCPTSTTRQPKVGCWDKIDIITEVTMLYSTISWRNRHGPSFQSNRDLGYSLFHISNKLCKGSVLFLIWRILEIYFDWLVRNFEMGRGGLCGRRERSCWAYATKRIPGSLWLVSSARKLQMRDGLHKSEALWSSLSAVHTRWLNHSATSE